MDSFDRQELLGLGFGIFYALIAFFVIRFLWRILTKHGAKTVGTLTAKGVSHVDAMKAAYREERQK